MTNDVRDALERVGAGFPFPEPAFERLLRRRERAARARRVRAAVVAIVVATLALGGLVGAFDRDASSPATGPITRTDVRTLHVIWSASGLGEGTSANIAAADGMVFVTDPGSGTLSAFPADCARTCSPSWTARIGCCEVMPDGPVIADGRVIVAEGTRLLAFETDCGTGGVLCSPSWRANLPTVAFQPILAGDTVYVGSKGGRLYAFDPRCASGGAVCDPTWSSAVQPDPLVAGAVGDGLVFAGTLPSRSTPHLARIYAFPVDCRDGCEPARVADLPGPYGSAPAVGGGVLVTGSADPDGSGAVTAYPLRCAGTPGCRPAWSDAFRGSANSPHPVWGDGVFVVDSGAGEFTKAYAADCGRRRCAPSWSAFSVGMRANAPVVRDGLVFVAAGESGVHVYPVACTPVAGRCVPLWSSAGRIAATSVTGVAVSDGLLFVRTSEGELVAFGPRR